MARIETADAGAPELLGVLGHRPELMQQWMGLDNLLMYEGALSPSLKYKVQMAMSSRGACEFCRSMVVPQTAEDRRESLAVAFAEMAQEDPTSINGGHYEALAEEFSDAEVVELTLLVCFKLAAIVLGTIWGLAPGPEEMKQGYAGLIADAQERWSAQADG
jgi:alkylhydroperoxidase family enzyme